jgi:acetyltransferase-like isoleucine patch superfamily enzyme
MKILKIIFEEIVLWFEFIISYLPGRSGIILRRLYFRGRLGNGENLIIGSGCNFIAPRAIKFYGTSYIAESCYFNASDGGLIEVGNKSAFNINSNLNASCGGKIIIGTQCMFGPGVILRTSNHTFTDTSISIQDQGHDPEDIIIEDDCWFGANVIILGGVKIGKGVVVGAGSVVTKDIPAMSVAVGVPAKVIKNR